MKRKSISLLVGALVIAGIIIGYALWNKPHETVDDQEGEKIEATVLANAFLENEQEANQKYLSKVLEVNGVVSEVTTNQDQKTVLLLESEDPLSGVQCTLKEAAEVQVGEKVTVKGFCNGFTTVVLLQDCILVKK